jgi:hypothetical protein
MLYKLVNYFDVWGNSKDGFEVNNLAVVENEVYISDDSTNKEIVQFLKSIGYFKKTVRMNMLDIYNDGELIEFFQKKDGMPIGRLEVEYCKS